MKMKIGKCFGVILICAAILAGCCAFAPEGINTTSEANIPSETEVTPVVIYETVEVPMVLKANPSTQTITTDRAEATRKLEIAMAKLEAAEVMAESCIILGYNEEHPVYQLACEEIQYATDDMNFYQACLEEIVLAEMAAEREAERNRLQDMIDNGEYPEAAYIWHYMRFTLGWNEYVCAGVMGNLMAEVGGQDFKLKVDAYGHHSKDYYGICQWYSAFYPQVQGADLDTQLQFLKDTVEYEFKHYGKLYKKGFTYQDFLALEDEQAAALAFAKIYERCGSSSHKQRQINAEKAYAYFANPEGRE